MSGRIVVETPAGMLEILSEGNFLTAVQKYEPVHADNDFFGNAVTRETERQLAEYFRGERTAFDLPISPKGTDFRRRVWNALMEIPYGETRSYSEIAAAVGKPSAQRAVGNAIGDNPILIVIPCHRVIRSDGGIGGFSAGIEMKEFLMGLEGI